MSQMMFLMKKLKAQILTSPVPIPALTCSDTAGLVLPSTHSYGYDFQSSPASSRICPASASGMLAQYSG